MAQTFAAVALGSIVWVALGYSLAFTGEGALIGKAGTVERNQQIAVFGMGVVVPAQPVMTKR